MEKTVIHITGKQSNQLMRLARIGDLVAAEPAPEHRISSLAQGAVQLEDLRADALFSALDITASNPLELLVPNDGSRRWSQPTSSQLRTKILSVDLPEGSFLRLKGGAASDALSWPDDLEIYVEAPELAIIRGAQALAHGVKEGKYSELQAFLCVLEFIDECCGSYSRDPFQPRGGEVCYDAPGELSRFVGPAQVASYLKKARGIDGLILARKAAPFAIDGSGSPMETYINHALTLPPRYAGLSMSNPLVNQQLVVSGEQRALIKHESLRPDFQWPEYRVLAEYLGNKEHASKGARIEDKNRMQDYASTSYAAFPLMFDDVRNAAALNRTAAMLAREFMKKGAKFEAYRLARLMKNEEFLGKQRVLVGTLLPPVQQDDA